MSQKAQHQRLEGCQDNHAIETQGRKYLQTKEGTPGIKSHSGPTHANGVGCREETRDLVSEATEARASEAGMGREEMPRSGNPHLKLARTGPHNGTGSERPWLANGRGWSWPWPITKRKTNLVGCAGPPWCYRVCLLSWVLQLVCQRTPSCSPSLVVWVHHGTNTAEHRVCEPRGRRGSVCAPETKCHRTGLI